MPNMSLLVTGSTGRLGGRVARRLAELRIPQRLLVRDMARAPHVEGSEVIQGSYSEAATLPAIFTGIETVLFVSGAEGPTRVAEHVTFIDAAVAAGVHQIVYVSLCGAAPNATFTLARDHWATEQHIRESGSAFTFLRDNVYLDLFPFVVGEDNVIRGPAGEGRVAAVALDDIAAVAAKVLQEPRAHAGKTYELTGPQALTLHEVATTLSKVTGRAITYRPETLVEAYASRAHYGAPQWQVEAWVSTYTAIAAGEMERLSRDIELITGRAPKALSEVLTSAANS